MTRLEWKDPSPAYVREVGEFPEGDELDLRELHIRGAAGSAPDVLANGDIVNCLFENVDVAGLVARNGKAAKTIVRDSRLRGVTWAGGVVEDVLFENVTGSDVSFRFTTLRRVTFRGCALPGIDFTEATFDRARFVDCRFPGAILDHATVKSLRIQGCDLSGATGAGALAGASIHPEDLIPLAGSLARAVGITIEEA